MVSVISCIILNACSPTVTYIHSNNYISIIRGFAGPLRRRVITETLPKFIALRNDTSLDQQRLVDYATTIANILDQAANVPYVVVVDVCGVVSV